MSAHVATRLPLLALILLPATSGCVVIEKKTLLLVLSAKSREVPMYYVFEGISVLEGQGSTLEKARKDLMAYQQPELSFFVAPAGTGNELLQKSFRFEKLRFFLDPSRPRRLCADRRVTLTDREAFAKELNTETTVTLRHQLQFSTAELEKNIRELNKDMEDRNALDNANQLGMGPLMKAAAGLGRVLAAFDRPSLERLKAAATADGYRWFRFEGATLCLTVPATHACARRIVADAKTQTWVQDMKEFVTPLRLKAEEDGLVLVLGGKGQPIRLTYRDSRPHRLEAEEALINDFGPSFPVLVNGKSANAERLIGAFLAETLPQR
jgi:hypothetical protein